MMCTRFKELRQQKGKTQEALASELGITKDYVNSIENGRRNPGFALAKRTADLFGVTVDELYFSLVKKNVILIVINLNSVGLTDTVPVNAERLLLG